MSNDERRDARTRAGGLISVTAPVRVADVGGWTDTWFSVTGAVCSIAMGPGVEVTVESSIESSVEPKQSSNDSQEAPLLELVDFGEAFLLDPSGRSQLSTRHPVLGQIVAVHLATETTVSRIRVRSAVPAGSSLGTSAAVGVALIAGIRAAADELPDAIELARLAHEAETGAGLEAGVQDHVGAALGGVSLIRVAFPRFVAEPIPLAERTIEWIARSARTVFLGRHDSSTTHRMVIDQLQRVADPSSVAELVELRQAAYAAADALRADDRHAYGLALLRSVEAQRGLHPDLIGPGAQQLIELALAHGGAAKVNGAGGHGGSVTLFGPEGDESTAQFDKALQELVATIEGAALLHLAPSSAGVQVTRV
jgi:D-glycero-alpha-D-manno-heptose-7-phosphate kinase